MRLLRPPRHRVARAGAATIAALALTLPALACGTGGGDPSIVLYNGQHPQLTTALIAAFTKRTGIQVQQRTNDGIVLADQLLQEGSASPADVYLTENSPELVTLDQHHLLAPLDRSTLAQVPASERAPTGDWAGVALRVGGLAYDPALISAARLPRSVLALAAPRWKGKIAIAPADSDFAPLVGAVIATYGTSVAQRWLAGLKRNAQIFQTDEAVVAAVNRGDVATGLINHYYWYRLRLEIGAGAIHSRVFYFPNHDVGSIENISGAAVLASSAHKRDAQRFIAFLVSRAAQEILAHSDDFEYPERAGVKPNPALRPLSTISPARLGPVKLGNDQQAARLIEQSGLV
jgi:iron(III) transport system substrate-binding protein